MMNSHNSQHKKSRPGMAKSLAVSALLIGAQILGPMSSANGSDGTVIGNLAVQMQAGTWAELQSTNIFPVLTSNGSSKGITSFANSAAWDPLSKRVFFTGGDHNDAPRFVSYSAGTNSWQLMPLPPFLSSVFPQWHGYDFSTIDTGRNRYYVGFEKYEIGSGSWSRLPDIPGVSFGRGHYAAAYFPELGGLVIAGDNAVYVYRDSTGQWSTLSSSLNFSVTSGCTGCDPIAEYNPVHKVMLFGGGDGSHQLYKLDSAGRVTALRPAPIEIAVYWGPVSVDPVSGKYLVFGPSRQFYIYDITTDTWSLQSGSHPITDIQQLISTPLSTYGVTMFVQRMADMSFKAWLYKYAAGSPAPPPSEDTSAPTIPTGLGASTTSSSQINLIWTASTDNVGVSGYRVYRNGTQIGTTSGTTYSDTGLAAATTHSYNIAAYDAANNVSSLSSSASATTSQASSGGGSNFAQRCQSPGVVLCEGLDALPPLNPSTPAPRGLLAGSKTTATIDTGTKLSGAGSLRFTIPGNSDSNTAGTVWYNFSDNYLTQFGPSQEFYVQWRQRFSPEMLNFYHKVTDGQGGFKTVIVGEGDNPGDTAWSCTELEVVMNNGSQSGMPLGYHSCGTFEGFLESYGSYDYKLQNAIPSPYCLWQNNQPGQVTGNPPCLTWKSNQWMTFQIHIKVGNWNQPNSRVEFWAAEEGKPSVKIVDMQNWVLHQTDPPSANTRYGKVWLLPYETGKDPSQSHPTYYTWYDELIVSTQKIPDPTTTSDLTPPQAPTNLRVN